jgi:hypothetical protein
MKRQPPVSELTNAILSAILNKIEKRVFELDEECTSFNNELFNWIDFSLSSEDIPTLIINFEINNEFVKIWKIETSENVFSIETNVDLDAVNNLEIFIALENFVYPFVVDSE